MQLRCQLWRAERCCTICINAAHICTLAYACCRSSEMYLSSTNIASTNFTFRELNMYCESHDKSTCGRFFDWRTIIRSRRKIGISGWCWGLNANNVAFYNLIKNTSLAVFCARFCTLYASPDQCHWTRDTTLKFHRLVINPLVVSVCFGNSWNFRASGLDTEGESIFVFVGQNLAARCPKDQKESRKFVFVFCC